MSGTFDGITGVVAARVMALMNADMERAAIETLAPHDGDRVLVVGFGPGVGIESLLDRADVDVLGIDPSPVMVRTTA